MLVQVVETLKDKLNKLKPATAEPALGCTSQTLWEINIIDVLLSFPRKVACTLFGAECLTLLFIIITKEAIDCLVRLVFNLSVAQQ